VPGTTYPCAPGGPNDYVFIYAQQQMWPAFCGVIGRPDLVSDPRFATEAARWENRAELEPLVAEWTRARDKHEVMRLMGDAGVPCGACQDTGEVLADPHLKAREMIVDIEYPTRGTYQTVGCPVKLSESPAESPAHRCSVSTPRRCSANCAVSMRTRWSSCTKTESYDRSPSPVALRAPPSPAMREREGARAAGVGRVRGSRSG
jgi:hypothetical protein